MRTLQLKGTEPALFDHWLVYRRVTTKRRLILYDLGTNQSRVIASVKMRSDLGEPDISGRRVVYAVTGKGRSSIRIYRMDLQTTRRVLETPIWLYSHASISGDYRRLRPPGRERRGGVAPRPRERAHATRLPGPRRHRATPCGRRPRTARRPSSRSTRSRSRSSGMLEAWQPRLRRRASCAPRSSRRPSGARAISTGWASCRCSPGSSPARSRPRSPSTRPRPASR